MNLKKCLNVHHIGQLLANIYFLYSFLIIPLYFDQAYFNIISAKAKAYFICSVPLFVATILLFIYCFYKKILHFEINSTSIFIVLFALTAFISTLRSGHIAECLIGNNGWYMGSYSIISMIIFAFLIKNFFNWSNIHLYLISAITIFICTIGILHSACIDVFNLHEEISLNQYFSYISTIGNANSFSGYLCLLFPFFFCLFVIEENKIHSCLELVVLFFLLMCVTLCNSESVFLGIIFVILFSIALIFQDNCKLKRTAIILLIYGITLLLIDKIELFEFKVRTFDELFLFTLDSRFCIGLIFVGIFLYFFKFNNKSLKFFFYLALILSILVIIFIPVFVYKNWNPYFGNNRGRIWETTFIAFKTLIVDTAYTFDYVLFGIGPEMLRGWYYSIGVDINAVVKVAHSEALQTLTTLGLIGFISYVGFFISIIKDYFVLKIWKNKYILLIIPIIAYFAQALVNSMYLSNGVILAFFVGLYLKNRCSSISQLSA